MSTFQLEILLIAMVVSVACSLPGVFLVLRRMSMMSDAISHSILPGIVVAFFLVQDLSSPWLILAATATGVLTVTLVELINRTRLVREDAAIGIVFPLLFSIGIILISRYAGNVHLDVDAVLLGEIGLAPFDRFVVAGMDLGPKSLALMGGIMLLNLLFITLFYKELKVSTFDAGLAAAMGFSPVVLHYALMAMTSVTAVGAFDTVGSILVVALMIAPPVSAYLLTDRLHTMLILSAIIGAVSSALGFFVAIRLDVSIAGAMSGMAGVIFLLVFLFAPNRGIVSQVRSRMRKRIRFATRMLTVHLFQHAGLPEASTECRVDHLHDHMNWDRSFAEKVLRYATAQNMIRKSDGILALTEKGQQEARAALVW